MKYLLLGLKYPSISNVLEDIATVLEENGHITHIIYDPVIEEKADRLVIFVPFNPKMLNAYLWKFDNFEGEKWFYTTCDGIPRIQAINPYILKKIKFIPNSEKTARNLLKVGVNIDLPLLHGVDNKLAKESEPMARKLREKLNKDFANKIKIGIVSGTSKRKNLDLTVETLNRFADNYPDIAKNFEFLVISHKQFLDYKVPSNVSYVSQFGEKTKKEIFAFYGAIDYLLYLSGLEGFGLPILESMAMGTPSIHLAISPLTEFSSWQYNFIISTTGTYTYYEDIVMQEWEIAKFDPEDVISVLQNLVSLDDREIRSRELKKIAELYDIRRQYTRFLT